MRNLVTVIALVFVSFICAESTQAQTHIRSTAVNISIKIPKRFVIISQDEYQTVYQENKTKTIFTVDKLGFSDFETEILLQAEIDYADRVTDDNNFDVSESTEIYSISNGYQVDWTTKKRTRYKNNDQNRSVLMQLNGTLYRFTLSYPSLLKKDALKTFSKILNSALPTFDER